MLRYQVIRAVKASEVEVEAEAEAMEIEAGANKEVSAIEGNNEDNVVVPNAAAAADFGAFDHPDEAAYFPDMESIERTSSISDEINQILNSLGSWNAMDDVSI